MPTAIRRAALRVNSLAKDRRATHLVTLSFALLLVALVVALD